jgi:rhamnosyltransferase
LRTNRRIAFIIAHYHVDGILGETMREIVNYLDHRMIPTLFISTNLHPNQAPLLPKSVTLITRENIGYDFYSYKIGLDHLAQGQDYDFICVLNNSFISIDAVKLLDRFIASLDESTDVVGLTISRELDLHLQSYLLAFSARVIEDLAFQNWWRNMAPLSERGKVIVYYELGLSRVLRESGFSIRAAYIPSKEAQLSALCHAIRIGFRTANFSDDGTVTLNLSDAESLNPTHFMWEELLDQFGIVKRELFEKNPFFQDLSRLFGQHADRLSRY